MSVQVMPLDALVDLVNGWGSQPRVEAGEEQQDFPPLAALLARLGLPDEGTGEVTDADVARVADLLYPVFTATELAERARLVTDLLARVGVRPALDAVGGVIRPSWLSSRAPPAMPCWRPLPPAPRAQLAEHGADRLGTCAGLRCADVFIDASPAGDRRFCSVTCQTRTRVAAFRRRNAPAAR